MVDSLVNVANYGVSNLKTAGIGIVDMSVAVRDAGKVAAAQREGSRDSRKIGLGSSGDGAHECTKISSTGNGDRDRR